jgi:hypothetical protein
LEDDWAIKGPDGDTSTVFWFRPDQKLNMLAIGAKLNNPRFNSKYGWQRFLEGGLTGAPIVAEIADPHNSYFKFNLDALTFYHLARFEGNRTYKGWYNDAYRMLRRALDEHGNAHFNMIDRAIQGANAQRDAETRRLLDEWLQRPRRDEAVDLRGVYPSCWEEDRACDAIPVPQRVRTDFLWQRSPFLHRLHPSLLDGALLWRAIEDVASGCCSSHCCGSCFRAGVPLVGGGAES